VSPARRVQQSLVQKAVGSQPVAQFVQLVTVLAGQQTDWMVYEDVVQSMSMVYLPLPTTRDSPSLPRRRNVSR